MAMKSPERVEGLSKSRIAEMTDDECMAMALLLGAVMWPMRTASGKKHLFYCLARAENTGMDYGTSSSSYSDACRNWLLRKTTD